MEPTLTEAGNVGSDQDRIMIRDFMKETHETLRVMSGHIDALVSSTQGQQRHKFKGIRGFKRAAAFHGQASSLRMPVSTQALNARLPDIVSNFNHDLLEREKNKEIGFFSEEVNHVKAWWRAAGVIQFVVREHLQRKRHTNSPEAPACTNELPNSNESLVRPTQVVEANEGKEESKNIVGGNKQPTTHRASIESSNDSSKAGARVGGAGAESGAAALTQLQWAVANLSGVSDAEEGSAVVDHPNAGSAAPEGIPQSTFHPASNKDAGGKRHAGAGVNVPTPHRESPTSRRKGSTVVPLAQRGISFGLGPPPFLPTTIAAASAAASTTPTLATGLELPAISSSPRSPLERVFGFMNELLHRSSLPGPDESQRGALRTQRTKTKTSTAEKREKALRVQSQGYEEAVRLKKKHKKMYQTRVVCSDSRYMLNPKNPCKMTWDVAAVMPLLVYLAVMIPFRLCFDNEPVLFSSPYWFEFTIDLVFICDILISFRTGNPLHCTEADLIEYDPWLVARNYLQGWFVFDCVSGIPFALIELLFASNTSNASALKSIKTLRIIRFLKLGRLLKLEKIMTNLNRDMIDRIEDFFSDIQTRSVLVVARLALKMGYAVHLLSCMWVLVGRLGSLADDDNWLIHELKGAFEASDTTGGRHVKSIYLAAYYYTLTTMTSVGYGDIITRNNTERAFTIFLEFVGSFVFAMITAALTSVVTSMDLNARKTAEQLDAVASFVKTRKFPEDLGRRVRRHFRHFYSMKSAIDETKIFNELSTSLRKEVSMYLVSELMGDVELFRNMSPVLLPRLLPLLRPMRFETDENVCEQGEESSEMYVVISGVMHGTTNVESDPKHFGPRVRRINAGDTVNSLCVLGVWNRCIETVVSDVPVESYAITEEDFEGLFSVEADVLMFEEMKERVIHHYAFDEDDYEAGVRGRPLYFCCFTTLDVTLVRGRDIAAADSVALSSASAEIEVVDSVTGKPLSRLWYAKTPGAARTVNPFWNQRVVWQDILAPLDSLVLRVTLIDSEFLAGGAFLGMCEIPFVDLLKLEPGPQAEGERSGSDVPRLGMWPSSKNIGRSYDEGAANGGMRDSAWSLSSAMRTQRQKERKLEPLEQDVAERWWDLSQTSQMDPSNTLDFSGPKWISSRRVSEMDRDMSTSPSSVSHAPPLFGLHRGASFAVKGAIQLRTRIRRPDRDPLPASGL